MPRFRSLAAALGLLIVTATAHADVNIGVLVSLTGPGASLAVIDVAARTGVPVISLAGGGAIVEPQDGPRRWAFKMAPTETISINAVPDHMLKNKATTVATISITTA